MDTSSVQYTLRPRDIEKASSLLELPMEELQHLNALRLLNTTYIRALLMRADYERLTDGLHFLEKADRRYRYLAAEKAIAREYGIGPKEASSIIHGKDESIYFCKQCGIRISPAGYRDRNGLCKNCYIDSLGL